MKFVSGIMKCLESATVLCSNRKDNEEETKTLASLNLIFLKSRTYFPVETMLRRTRRISNRTSVNNFLERN